MDVNAPDDGSFVFSTAQSSEWRYRNSVAVQERSFGVLHAPRSDSSSTLAVSAQGHGLLSQTLTAVRRQATDIRGIVRTAEAWADRKQIRVAYQVHDSMGNVQVDVSEIRVVLQMELQGSVTVPWDSGGQCAANGRWYACASSSCRLQATCASNTGLLHCACPIDLQPTTALDSLYSQDATCMPPDSTTGVGLCSSSTPASWFHLGASMGLALRVSYGDGAVVANNTAGAALLHSPPFWWDMSTSANFISSDGMYAIIPASPRYLGETFEKSIRPKRSASIQPRTVRQRFVDCLPPHPTPPLPIK